MRSRILLIFSSSFTLNIAMNLRFPKRAKNSMEEYQHFYGNRPFIACFPGYSAFRGIIHIWWTASELISDPLGIFICHMEVHRARKVCLKEKFTFAAKPAWTVMGGNELLFDDLHEDVRSHLSRNGNDLKLGEAFKAARQIDGTYLGGPLFFLPVDDQVPIWEQEEEILAAWAAAEKYRGQALVRVDLAAKLAAERVWNSDDEDAD